MQHRQPASIALRVAAKLATIENRPAGVELLERFPVRACRTLQASHNRWQSSPSTKPSAALPYRSWHCVHWPLAHRDSIDMWMAAGVQGAAAAARGPAGAAELRRRDSDSFPDSIAAIDAMRTADVMALQEDYGPGGQAAAEWPASQAAQRQDAAGQRAAVRLGAVAQAGEQRLHQACQQRMLDLPSISCRNFSQLPL